MSTKLKMADWRKFAVLADAFYRAMHYSAKSDRMSSVCLSVRLSVCL